MNSGDIGYVEKNGIITMTSLGMKAFYGVGNLQEIKAQDIDSN